MPRRRVALAVALLTAVMLYGAPVAAEVGEVRLLRQPDLADLVLLVAEHEKLIEKQAQNLGLGGVAVHWQAPPKGGAFDALLAGQGDAAAVDLAPFVAAWDDRLGTPQELRALAALVQMPYVLVARRPDIKTIRDFTDKDRIAVPALKTSGPAVMLEMAAAQEWGIDHFNKLDPLMLARPDNEAAAALASGNSEIDAHVARSPVTDDELGGGAVHRVMDSFDIAGPHSAGALVLTARFHDANPALCRAILAALNEAVAIIKREPGAAAEIYASMVKDRDVNVEDLSDMIGDPDFGYTLAPTGAMRTAQFMNRIGRTKHRPTSWQDLFFPEAHNLPGS